MTQQIQVPSHNSIRYEILVRNYKEHDNVVYKITVLDLAMGVHYMMAFRFSEIKKIHQSIIKENKEIQDSIPQLPRTHSIWLFNKTNSDHKKVQQRMKDLGLYFKKLLNNPMLKTSKLIQSVLLNSSQMANRTQTAFQTKQCTPVKKRVNTLPVAQLLSEFKI